MIKAILVIFMLTSSSCEWSNKKSIATRVPTSLDQASDNVACRAIPLDKFSIDSYIEEIKSRKTIRSVEEALCIIPSSIRSNYVLVHTSRSAQGSRPEAPRAIIYKSKKRNGLHELEYAISFNGNSEDTNFNNIEIVKGNHRAQESEQHFEYIDIEFDENGKNNPHVSEPNPQECMMCHGVQTNRARAIWDAKGFTPTVYGASTFRGTIGEEEYIEQFKSLPRQ